MSTISLMIGRANVFKSSSFAHSTGSNDDDHPGGATPIALTEPPCDDWEALEALTERPHQPWLVPGVGTSF